MRYANRPDGLFAAGGRWNLKRCSNSQCGLLWLDPAPVTEDLPLAYETYFTHASAEGSAATAHRMRELLYRAYLGVGAIPAALFGLRRPKRELSLMFLGDRPPGSVLDVGCGDGEYLARMKPLGWAVDGVDFDAQAIASARVRHGLTLRCGDLASQRFPTAIFDAVTMRHVIEHVPEPVPLLAEAARILKPGGRLVVVTPNSASLGHEIFQAHWFGLDPPRHLQIFGLPPLAACAKAAGLEVERAFTTAANADIFIGGSCSIRAADAGSGGRSTQPGIHIFRTLRAIVGQYRELWRLKTWPDCGEEAVLVCRKQ